MKFLLFNVAVATALVFLFTAERGEVQKIAGQVHDAAGEMKEYANKAFNTGQAVMERTAENKHSAPVPAPRKPLSPPPAVQPTVKPAAPAAKSKPAPAPAPPPPSQLARNLPPMPEVAPPGKPKAVPEIGASRSARLDPDVAKRRKEILDGLDTAGDTAPQTARATPALKDGARLMTASERRKELLSLAEEMELLYARSISQ